MNTSNLPNSILLTLRQKLCCGCGICQAVCPTGAVTMRIEPDKGIYLPRLDTHLCQNCGKCLKVCPGTGIDLDSYSEVLFGGESPNLTQNSYTAFSSDSTQRNLSTSGGVATALLVYALETGLIDGALVSRNLPSSPLIPASFVARTLDELKQAAGSKYCPVAADTAISEITAQPGRYAVVGLPCHIQAIRKAESQNPVLKQRIAIHLGIICSSTMSFKGTEYILKRQGINKESLTSFHYRTNGWPGNMQLELACGNRLTLPLKDYHPYHGHGFFTPHRCLMCNDQLNELADISLGDAWLKELENDHEGTSAVIVRGNTGQEFYREAVRYGYIKSQSLSNKRVMEWRNKRQDYATKKYILSMLGWKLPEYPSPCPPARKTAYLYTIEQVINYYLGKTNAPLIIEPAKHIWVWLTRIADRLIRKQASRD
ncbi:Coenzyme F420 hydrogenase/dehydrogenase, beta subunit C-terminal domain [Dehalococcoides sp. THU3]|uniref:Coenzyme F420 hydrogenase/dehydrogenase, beta subunit C-terminal domain n=1 Tax=Dehalococcoides TaxID=61434 RepID=UPI0005B57E20|nr:MULTISPECIES: Coenzyme F420 hydrogenase/dehydrogenase, beta subunit C-terminal domain [Dehalococcoides]UJP38256.1 Coenzyme F420 hydrogenase/dehydrogenase, beta subunit C-terminal domain [Dehalococcoides mccartyi]BAQ34202.1 hypothetical protein UCH007_02440 [Dehalococcoides sp. UCH007]